MRPVGPKWMIDNEDGVPCLPSGVKEKDLTKIDLLVLIEEHTMTFGYGFHDQIVKDDVAAAGASWSLWETLKRQTPSERCPEVELADSFYNHEFNGSFDERKYQSPYSFGSGRVDLREINESGTFQAGMLEVFDVTTGGDCEMKHVRCNSMFCLTSVCSVGTCSTAAPSVFKEK